MDSQWAMLTLALEHNDRDHFVDTPSQWEMTLQCNVLSYWLGAYTKWSMNEQHELQPNGHQWTRPSAAVQNFNTLKLRQNGRHFADDTFNRISLNENVRISIKISLKFIPKDPETIDILMSIG